MAVAVSEVEQLREYVRGVLSAAQHHAGNVDEIILAIAGAIIARKDDTPLQVRAGRTQEMGRAYKLLARPRSLRANLIAKPPMTMTGDRMLPVLEIRITPPCLPCLGRASQL